ncbi:GyrI-like domain-containing protein [candidate division WOR-3 bacterium]|nr:GyrI-like domain-containing protein [candidate division WOR-3 bacterium]
MKKAIKAIIVLILALILIGGLAMSFLLNKIGDTEPEIVTLQEPIKFVGLSVKTDVKSIYKDATQLGKDYSQFKKTHTITNLKEPWAFVAYSRDFDEKTRSWEYIMGDVVTNLDSVPEGLNGYEIEPGKYAIFQIKAKLGFLWGLEIGRMKKYVFTEWVSKSNYTATGSDFEYHDKRSIGKNPSIDLYVAIREKE